jgi:hypothetical protein
MAQPTLAVKNATGTTVTINTITDAGRAAATDSQSTAMATEDKAVLDAISASLAGTLAVAGRLVPVAVEFSRPADTSAYVANDAVANSTSAPTALTFTDIMRVDGGSGYIVHATLLTNQALNVSQFRLHLFSASPTMDNDNAASVLRWSERASYLGFIDFDALQSEGSGSDAAVAVWQQHIAVAAAAGSRTLYAKLETKLGFTPASGQTFRVSLTVDQN